MASTVRPAAPLQQAHVFLAAPGKHLFQRLWDERLVVYPQDWTGELAPDLVVIPCGQPRQFMAFDGGLPEPVRRRAASGEARVVFDGSSEGFPHSPDLSRAFHSLLQRMGAPSGRAVYITQHRGVPADYRAFCAAEGAPAPMTVLNYDYWIKRLLLPYQFKGTSVLNRRRAFFHRRARARPRRFLSLNWSLRPAKLVFLLRLMHDGLWDQGHVSYGGLDQLELMKMGTPDRLMKAVRGFEGFKDFAESLSPYVKRLLETEPIQFGAAPSEPLLKGFEKMAGDMELPEYQQSWFSVVTETEMAARPARVTEKALKPLLNYHPFLLLGNPGSLAFLRGLGFETFPELFDETYDAVAEPRARFDMVYAELTRLCRMEEADLDRIEAGIADKLEHNARLALTELPRRYREEIDRELIDQLVPGLPPPAQALGAS